MRHTPTRFASLFLVNALFITQTFFVSAAHAGDVHYDTRVDGKEVFVDVENDSEADVQVAQLVVSFYDKDHHLLVKSKIDCTKDCSVPVDAASSFGPLTGPEKWDTVEVTKVYYNDNGADAIEGDDEEGTDDEAAPESKPKPKVKSKDESKAPETKGPKTSISTLGDAAKGNVPASASSEAPADNSFAAACMRYCNLSNSVSGCAIPEDAKACPDSCKELAKSVNCQSKMFALDACAAKEKFTCKSPTSVNLGACETLSSDFFKCSIGK